MIMLYTLAILILSEFLQMGVSKIKFIEKVGNWMGIFFSVHSLLFLMYTDRKEKKNS